MLQNLRPAEWATGTSGSWALVAIRIPTKLKYERYVAVVRDTSRGPDCVKQRVDHKQDSRQSIEPRNNWGRGVRQRYTRRANGATNLKATFRRGTEQGAPAFSRCKLRCAKKLAGAAHAKASSAAARIEPNRF